MCGNSNFTRKLYPHQVVNIYVFYLDEFTFGEHEYQIRYVLKVGGKRVVSRNIPAFLNDNQVRRIRWDLANK